MSNHSGSYMLNDVLTLLDEEGVFDLLGQQKTEEMLAEIIAIGQDYDCNSGEILEDIGQKLGFCYYCCRPGKNLVNGICDLCRKE